MGISLAKAVDAFCHLPEPLRTKGLEEGRDFEAFLTDLPQAQREQGAVLRAYARQSGGFDAFQAKLRQVPQVAYAQQRVATSKAAENIKALEGASVSPKVGYVDPRAIERDLDSRTGKVTHAVDLAYDAQTHTIRYTFCGVKLPPDADDATRRRTQARDGAFAEGIEALLGMDSFTDKVVADCERSGDTHRVLDVTIDLGAKKISYAEVGDSLSAVALPDDVAFRFEPQLRRSKLAVYHASAEQFGHISQALDDTTRAYFARLGDVTPPTVETRPDARSFSCHAPELSIDEAVALARELKQTAAAAWQDVCGNDPRASLRQEAMAAIRAAGHSVDTQDVVAVTEGPGRHSVGNAKNLMDFELESDGLQQVPAGEVFVSVDSIRFMSGETATYVLRRDGDALRLVNKFQHLVS